MPLFILSSSTSFSQGSNGLVLDFAYYRWKETKNGNAVQTGTSVALVHNSTVQNGTTSSLVALGGWETKNRSAHAWVRHHIYLHIRCCLYFYIWRRTDKLCQNHPGRGVYKMQKYRISSSVIGTLLLMHQTIRFKNFFVIFGRLISVGKPKKSRKNIIFDQEIEKVAQLAPQRGPNSFPWFKPVFVPYRTWYQVL